ncbi:MAG: PQQ-binding-like beta-propeller repeat protein, partial [Candidatus Aenigmarchaeota archaeon]|nr:PQQ-binding-like beta-propeller repeat protein [Candidatus Aenigmarchaeota archaeon]
GKELWRFKCGGVTLGFGILNNEIYITSEDGFVYCLSPDGKEVWRFKAGEGVFDYPTFYDNKIYFGSWDCNFYCVDSITREEVWRFETSSRVPALAPAAKELFKAEIKRRTNFEEASSEDKYKSKKSNEISLSDYHVKSEYASTSEYKQKSDYDTSFVMFENVMEVEGLWISGSKVLTQNFQISK